MTEKNKSDVMKKTKEATEVNKSKNNSLNAQYPCTSNQEDL